MGKKITLLKVLPIVFLIACANMGEPTTFAKVCQKDDGTLVAVEGFVILPNFMNTETNQKYELFLAAQPDGKGGRVKTFIPATKSGEPNRIAELPESGYTQKDLRIYTDAGAVVGSFDRVKVTGKVSRAADGCRIEINKIENP